MRCLTGVAHDEILLETVDYVVNTRRKFVEQTMIEEGGGLYLESVPVKVDVKDGDTWAIA